jgi:hypothetical protein
MNLVVSYLVERYLHLLGHQAPIESKFLAQLPDHLNAEVGPLNGLPKVTAGYPKIERVC